MNDKEKYYFHFCWNGRKNKVHCTDEVSKHVFNNFEWYIPYDIIDEDDHNIWFDDGDE